MSDLVDMAASSSNLSDDGWELPRKPRKVFPSYFLANDKDYKKENEVCVFLDMETMQLDSQYNSRALFKSITNTLRASRKSNDRLWFTPKVHIYVVDTPGHKDIRIALEYIDRTIKPFERRKLKCKDHNKEEEEKRRQFKAMGHQWKKKKPLAELPMLLGICKHAKFLDEMHVSDPNFPVKNIMIISNDPFLWNLATIWRTVDSEYLLMCLKVCLKCQWKCEFANARVFLECQ